MKISGLSPSINKNLLTTSNSSENQKLKSLANDFEAIFLNIMITSMRKSVQKSDFMTGGHGEKIYQNLLDREYAGVMAKEKWSTLSEAIYKQLSKSLAKTDDSQKTQEKRQNIQAMQAYRLPIIE